MPKVPNVVLQDLRCKHCRRWLSCGPVYVLPQGSSLCGRCENIAIKQFRHSAYEALASYFHYPCHYFAKRCPSMLQWNDSLEHEEDCEYQNFCTKLCSHPTAVFKSERKLDITEEIRCEYIPEYIVEYLKCSICDRFLSCSPVYVRVDGKSICHRCVTSNGVPTDAIRHKAFEILADIVVFPCIYRERGCTQHFKFGRDIATHEMECSYGNFYQGNSKRGKGNKERGVIETHTGHVYGTITPNALHLFAPQSQNTKKTTVNGQVEVTREPLNEETDEFVNALKKQQQRFSRSSNPQTPISGQSFSRQPENKFSFTVQNIRPNSIEIPRIDPQKLNGSGNGLAGLSRTSSMLSSGNPDLIAELKVRQMAQRNSTRDDDERSSHSSKSREANVNLCSNLDDIFWVYDEVMHEYRNSSGVRKKLISDT